MNALQQSYATLCRPGLMAALLAIGIAVSARADTLNFPTNLDSALSVTLTGFAGTPISLSESQAKAMQQATAVREAEAALRAAEGARRRERGSFDPELFADIRKSRADEPAASAFAGANVVNSDQTVTSTGVQWQLPFGTRFEAALNATRLKTNSTFSTLNPQYSANGSLTLVQPLLRGFGTAAQAELSATGREREAAQTRYDLAVVSTAVDVENAYWDLFAAERDLAVQMLVREQAQVLLDEARIRAAAGLVGPNEEATAQVFLAEQDQAVLDREEALDRASNSFASLIGSRPSQGQIPRFRPSDSPPLEVPRFGDVESLVKAAMARSHYVRSAELALDASRVRYKGAKWNALPQLDLIGAIGGSGLAGEAQQVIFGTDTLTSAFGGSSGDAVSDVFKRSYPSWTVGVRFSLPIFLRHGRGERDRLRGETDQAEQQLIAVKRSVEEQVYNRYQELDHARRRLEAARTGVTASQEQVRIGGLEYSAGRTTAFELVRLGADLASAQQRYSQALVRAAKASAELRRLLAGSLDQETRKL